MKNSFYCSLLTIFFFPTVTVNGQDFWQQIIKAPYGGFLYALAVSSNGQIFAGSSGGTIYKTSHSENKWIEIKNGIRPIDDIEIFVINSKNYIFAGTRYGCIYRSTNNGESWVLMVKNLDVFRICSFAINNRDQIFAGTQEGHIYRSVDDGNTWNRIASLSTWVRSLSINSNNYIFAATDKGIYRSIDHGDKWVQINNGLNDTIVFSIAVSPEGYLFAGTLNGHIYRSINNGNTWDITIKDLRYEVNDLVINSRGEIFAGIGIMSSGNGIYCSIDKGDTWKHCGLIKRRIKRLVIDLNDHIYAATDNGIYQSQDNGNNWIKIGVGSKYISPFAINSMGHLFALIDESLSCSVDQGTTWKEIITATDSFSSFRPRDLFINYQSDTIFATDRDGHVYRSIDHGDTWTLITKGRVNDGWWPDVNMVAIDFRGDIFFGTDKGIYRSTNNGNTWSLLNNEFRHRIEIIAINSNGYIFSITKIGEVSTEIYRSTDNGVTWVKKNIDKNHNPIVFSFIISNSNDYIFARTSDGVYRSTNNGDTWTKISSILTGLSCKSLVINSKGDIFAVVSDTSDYTNIYCSTDNGKTWVQINNEIRNAIINSLEIDHSDYLYALTKKRGIFRSANPAIFRK